VPKPATTLAQAPAAVIPRQNNPSQKAMPSIGAIDSQIFRPSTRLGSQ
jgi:hypothetical protein